MVQLPVAMLNKKGMTLVEVLIALVVLLLVFLALMQTALVSIDSNTRNILRDEALSIAEARMTDLRNRPFDDALLADTGGVFVAEAGISRNFRGFAVTFTPLRRIADLGAGDDKQVDITIRWDWKENTFANGNPYTHAISTILRRP